MFDPWTLIVGFIIGVVTCSLAFGWSEYRHREKMRRKVIDLEDELSQSARREALHRADAAQLRKVIAKATSAGVIQTEGRLGPLSSAKPKSKPKPVAVLPVGHQSTRRESVTHRTDPVSDNTLTAILAGGLLVSPSEPARSEPVPTPEPAPSYTTGGGDSGGGFSTGGSSPGSDFSTGGSI